MARLHTLRNHKYAEHVRKLVGWTVLGVLGVGGEFVLLTLFAESVRLPVWLASALAGELAILARFLSTDRLVFHHRTPTWGRMTRYHGACALAFVISWGILNGLVSLAGVPYQPAWALGTVLSLVISAASNFLWVWRLAPAASTTPAGAPASQS